MKKTLDDRILLGKTGVAVPEIGLGCAGMSRSYGPVDDGEALSTLRKALDLGIRLFDTAEAYGDGENETLLGKFIKDASRDAVLVATKCGYRRQSDGNLLLGNDPAYIKAACEASLKRLNVDFIDLYYLHRRDPEVPLADSIGAMARLVEAGKVRWIGMCEVSAATLREANAIHPITALQSEYSLTTREPEDEILPACRELRITFVPFGPLGRALLTGVLARTKLDAGDFRSRLPRFSGEAAVANAKLAERLAAFAQARGATAAQVALAWLLAKNDGKTSIIPIPGTKRPKYVEENVAAAHIRLSPDDVAELDAMFSRGAVEGARYSGEAEFFVGT